MRKKKYNPHRHMEQAMSGCRFIYDGNDDDLVQSCDRFGKQLQPKVFNAMIDKPWRWHLQLKIVARCGELTRNSPHEWVLDQRLTLNELGFLIDDTQTAVMLEMPASFKFDHVEWVAKVISG